MTEKLERPNNKNMEYLLLMLGNSDDAIEDFKQYVAGLKGSLHHPHI